MFAATSGHLQTLQALSRAGADLHMMNYYRRNVLHHALYCSRTETFLYFMVTMNRYHLAQNPILDELALEGAFRFGKHNIQTLLLNIAPDPEAYCPGRFNILAFAVRI